ncbi:hypothetical protein ACS0VU_02125 [Aliiroseovarius sp. KMU-71]|jgi:hypothetical protein
MFLVLGEVLKKCLGGGLEKMFRWIAHKVRRASVKAYERDIKDFTNSLKGMDGSELGALLVSASYLKSNLEEGGVLPRASLSLSIPRDEAECGKVALHISQLIQEFQKAGHNGDAAAAMVWLHSVRALNAPEIRYLGKSMWRELCRGYAHFEEAFDLFEKLFSEQQKVLPKTILFDLGFIPDGLDPDE